MIINGTQVKVYILKLNETDDREDDELSPEELANKYAGSPFFKENLAQTLAETIKLGEGVIEEELCDKGKAYIKRRKAAGEKSSAYLSGRAVKVCKGQMSGTSKKKTNESLINKDQKPTQKLDNLLNKIKKDFNIDNE